MKTTLSTLFALSLAALYIWLFSAPTLSSAIADPFSHLGLLTLSCATLFGGLAVVFSGKRSPLVLPFKTPFRGLFVWTFVAYIVTNVPSIEARVFLENLWAADSWNSVGATIRLAWDASRGSIAGDGKTSGNIFLWLIGAPFIMALVVLPISSLPARAVWSTIGVGALAATTLTAMLGTLEHVRIAAVSVAAPFAIFLSTSMTGAIAAGKVRAAAMRQPGFEARFLYAIGGIAAALWIVFYSVPRLSAHWSIDNSAWLAAIEQVKTEHWSESGLFTSEAWRSPQFFILAVAVGCFGLLTQCRLSPITLPARAPLIAVPIWWPVAEAFCFLTVSMSFGSIIGFGAGFAYALLSSETSLKARPWVLVLAQLAVTALLARFALNHVDLALLRAALLGIVLPAAMFGLAAMPVIIPELLKELSKYRQTYVHGQGGSARWAGLLSFLKRDFMEVMDTPEKATSPIYLGKTFAAQDSRTGTRHVGIEGSSSMFSVFASMGSGKSFSSIWCTLLGWMHGAFVLDPKGEHAMRTGPALEAKTGRPSHYFDPFKLSPHLYETKGVACFNPLDEIDPQSPSAAADLRLIAEACFDSAAQETENSRHFRGGAINIVTGLLAHLLSSYDKEFQNLPAAYRLFLTGYPDGGATDAEAFKALVNAMACDDSFSSAPQKAAKLLLAAGVNEGGAFQTTVSEGLEWAVDDSLEPLLKHSTFKMQDIKQKRERVFLMIPFKRMQSEPIRRFMRVVVSAALVGCQAPAKHGKKTLFILDEFPQLSNGAFRPIKEGLVTLRSANVLIACYFQHLNQLVERYSNAGDFLSSSTKVFFGVTDIDTAKAISEMLGEYMEPMSDGRRFDQSRPLRSPAEILDDLAKGSGVMYVIPTDGLPMRLKMTPFNKLFARYGRLRGMDPQ